MTKSCASGEREERGLLVKSRELAVEEVMAEIVASSVSLL